MKETPGNLSTITRNLMIRSATSLISLLTAIRGHLLSFVLKCGNAELSVRTVIESTRSNNKATTPSKPSKPPSESLPPVTNSSSDFDGYHYKDAGEFLHDLQRGKIPMRAVTMEQFLLAHAWIAVDNNSPRIKQKMMINGGIYDMMFQIQSVKYPEEGRNLAGGMQ